MDVFLVVTVEIRLNVDVLSSRADQFSNDLDLFLVVRRKDIVDFSTDLQCVFLMRTNSRI